MLVKKIPKHANSGHQNTAWLIQPQQKPSILHFSSFDNVKRGRQDINTQFMLFNITYTINNQNWLIRAKMSEIPWDKLDVWRK